uniref:nuclear factor 7, brain-like n=1 Tax=Semicossyphus pulcher TaxID=241346 RepID=UPI0037E7FAA9
MAKLKEELWKILQDLREDDFEQFKWFLKLDGNVEGYSGIPVAQLEKAGRQHAVDLLVQKYQGHGALTVTMKVLEKISRNDLVERLQNSSTEPMDLGSCESVAVTCDFEKKKAELGAKIKLMIDERHMKIKEIKCSAELSSKSADRYIRESEMVFTVLMKTLKESLDYFIKSINEKRKTTQKESEKLISELEQEISELTKRSSEVEQLTPTKDQLNVVNSFASVKDIPPTKNWTETNIPPPSYGGSVATSVSQLEEKLRKEKEKFIAKGKLYRVQQFAKHVTLDPDTAHPCLILSDDGKQVYCGAIKQNLPRSSKRFLSAINVLGKQSFSSGRFYYEVQVEGKTSWDLGVVRESIDRKGRINASPDNGYWTICLREGQTYKASGSHLNVKSQPKTVGVFVDYGNPSVSFFDVDSADIIHRFTECSFTEKLYPFFSPGLHLSGTHVPPLVISPVNYTD